KKLKLLTELKLLKFPILKLKQVKTNFMLRFVFILLITLSIAVNSTAQSKKEKKAIKTWGIKSVTEMVTENVNGKETTRKDSYTIYDKNANKTYYEEYKKDGTLKHKESTKY
ncbi:MAG: hypothetical protein COZ59_03840, partial [Bacteroidetes bacterium CG_4_8_14_3_um_filter_31_14]